MRHWMIQSYILPNTYIRGKGKSSQVGQWNLSWLRREIRTLRSPERWVKWMFSGLHLYGFEKLLWVWNRGSGLERKEVLITDVILGIAIMKEMLVTRVVGMDRWMEEMMRSLKEDRLLNPLKAKILIYIQKSLRRREKRGYEVVNVKLLKDYCVKSQEGQGIFLGEKWVPPTVSSSLWWRKWILLASLQPSSCNLGKISQLL